MPGFDHPYSAIAATTATEISAKLRLIDGRPTSRIQMLPLGRVEMRDGRGPFFVRDAEAVTAAQRALVAAQLPAPVARPLEFADSRLVDVGAGRVVRLLRYRLVRRLRVRRAP